MRHGIAFNKKNREEEEKKASLYCLPHPRAPSKSDTPKPSSGKLLTRKPHSYNPLSNIVTPISFPAAVAVIHQSPWAKVPKRTTINS